MADSASHCTAPLFDHYRFSTGALAVLTRAHRRTQLISAVEASVKASARGTHGSGVSMSVSEGEVDGTLTKDLITSLGRDLTNSLTQSITQSVVTVLTQRMHDELSPILQEHLGDSLTAGVTKGVFELVSLATEETIPRILSRLLPAALVRRSSVVHTRYCLLRADAEAAVHAVALTDARAHALARADAHAHPARRLATRTCAIVADVPWLAHP